MTDIRGFQKTTLVDYPGKVAATVFLGGCNMRCPYCHNPAIVLKTAEIIPEEKVIDILLGAKKWLDGICITGGEPTLQKDLPGFAKKLKDVGFLIKLDTNGTNPAMLEEMLKAKLLDYIAMDIKAAPDDYEKASGAKVNMEHIKKSAKLIMDSGVDYEFRTTVVPEFFNETSAKKIGEWLKGAKRYYLQEFRPAKEMIDSDMKNARPYSKAEMNLFVEILRTSFGEVELRD